MVKRAGAGGQADSRTAARFLLGRQKTSGHGADPLYFCASDAHRSRARDSCGPPREAGPLSSKTRQEGGNLGANARDHRGWGGRSAVDRPPRRERARRLDGRVRRRHGRGALPTSRQANARGSCRVERQRAQAQEGFVRFRLCSSASCRGYANMTGKCPRCRGLVPRGIGGRRREKPAAVSRVESHPLPRRLKVEESLCCLLILAFMALAAWL